MTGSAYHRRHGQDVFRAVARATGPLLNARDLASITIKHAEEQAKELNFARKLSEGKPIIADLHFWLKSAESA